MVVTKEKKLAALAALAAGKTLPQVMEETGVPRTTLYRLKSAAALRGVEAALVNRPRVALPPHPGRPWGGGAATKDAECS